VSTDSRQFGTTTRFVSKLFGDEETVGGYTFVGGYSVRSQARIDPARKRVSTVRPLVNVAASFGIKLSVNPDSNRPVVFVPAYVTVLRIYMIISVVYCYRFCLESGVLVLVCKVFKELAYC
jgi:hypothetical protein